MCFILNLFRAFNHCLNQLKEQFPEVLVLHFDRTLIRHYLNEEIIYQVHLIWASFKSFTHCIEYTCLLLCLHKIDWGKDVQNLKHLCIVNQVSLRAFSEALSNLLEKLSFSQQLSHLAFNSVSHFTRTFLQKLIRISCVDLQVWLIWVAYIVILLCMFERHWLISLFNKVLVQVPN